MKIKEEMGVSAIAGIGAAPKGVDPSSAEAKKFAEPGVDRRKKKKRDPRVTKDPMKRSSLMGFKAWTKNQ